MGWFFGIVAVTLGLVLAWGLVSPRSQWRVLRAWSVADRHRDEPGGIAYGFVRLFSALGIAGLAAVGLVGASTIIGGPVRQAAPPTVAEQVWGSPAPLLLNRVTVGATEAPADLLSAPVLAYRTFDEGIDSYLLQAVPYSLLGDQDVPGLLGEVPEEGTSAIGASNLLINVRGPLLCIPRQAVVVETEQTVQVGVFYGLPDTADGTPADSLTSCTADAAVTGSLLVPLQLSGPVGDRTVIDLTGAEVPYARLP